MKRVLKLAAVFAVAFTLFVALGWTGDAPYSAEDEANGTGSDLSDTYAFPAALASMVTWVVAYTFPPERR